MGKTDDFIAMARARIPAYYGAFQFCLRLVVFVVEICVVAALVTLTKYNLTWPLGYVVSCLGLIFEMVEMITLASNRHHIKRLSSRWLAACDFVLLALAMASFALYAFRDGWTPPRNEFEYFDQIHDPYRNEKDLWSPWYIWLQLTAGVFHCLCMTMHLVDAWRARGA